MNSYFPSISIIDSDAPDEMSNLNSSSKLFHFFEQAKLLIEDNEDKLFIKSIINDLFQQIVKINNVHENIMEYRELFVRIAEFIKLVSYADPIICELFIAYISKLPVPIHFINIIPAMFSMSSKDVIEILAKQLFELATSDQNLLIQILCVLTELPLSNQLANTIMKLTQNIIQDSDDDDDMPSLFRIITKLSNLASSELTIFLWRKRLSKVSIDDLAIIIETMLSILPGYKKVAQIMINQLQLEEKQRSNRCLNTINTSKIPISDLSIVLIILSYISFPEAHQLCYLWLVQNRFPFEILTKLPALRKSNEVWGKLSSCLWNLCIWLFDQISSSEAYNKPVSTSNFLTANMNTHNRDAIGKLVDLTSAVYSSYPAMRESIVTILLGRCFPQNEHLEYNEVLSDNTALDSKHNFQYLTRNSDHNKICEIVPLGQALNRLSVTGKKQMNTIYGKSKQTNNRNRSFQNILKFSFHKACISVDVLHKLSANYNEVGSTVLKYVISKLLQQVIDVKQVFPKPFILLKLIECAVMGTKHSIQMESSFFILVQKLLSFVNTASQISNYNFDYLFTNSFSTPSNCKLLKSLHLNVNNSNLNKINSIVPLQHYASSTLGLILASYLLLRKSPMIAIQDYHSILNSITKSFSIYQDASVLCAIDGLSYCLYELHYRSPIYMETMSKGIVIDHNNSNLSSNTSEMNPSDSLCYQQHNLNGSSLDGLQNVILFQTVYNLLNKLLQSGKIIKTLTNFNVGKQYQQLGFRTCFLNVELTFSKIYEDFVIDVLKNNINDCNRSKFIVWDFSEVSSMIVDMAYTLSYITRSAHIQETINEMLDLCNNLFYLVQKVSFSYSLLYNICRSDYHKMLISNSTSSLYNTTSCALHSEDSSSWTHLIRLSFPISDLYKTKGTTQHQHKTKQFTKRTEEEDIGGDDDHRSVQFLNSIQSCMLLASSWSVAAADAFAGEYVLPIGLTTKSALILSWERALVVSFQSGKCCLDEICFEESKDIISENTASIIRKCLLLFCQLHSARLMLRVAHSQQALVRTTNKSSGQANKLKHKVNENKKRNLFPFEHLIGKSSDTLNTARSRQHTINENKESLEKQEFNAELENIQRQSLQRFLTRSIHDLPGNHVLLCLKYILDWGKDSGCSSSYDKQSMKYLTDGGLSLISHFSLIMVEKYTTKECNQNIAINRNETDRFVSLLSSNKINKPNEQSLTDLSDCICNCLLSKLPILLREIEISRNTSNKIENKISETPQNTHLPDLETSLGNQLDRYGKKILILILFKLFEVKLVVMNDFFIIDLANQTQKLLLNQMILGNTDSPTTFTSIGEAKAYLYNTLEKELMLQHDSTIETVGLRSLSIILKSSNNNRSKENYPRIASIAWHLMRNIYTESIDMGTHMFHALYNNQSQSSMPSSKVLVDTSPPGMDDMWPILAELVTNQSILDQAIAEVAIKLTKKTEIVVSLMRSCFSTKSDFQCSKPNSDQQHDLQSNAAYRQFWLRWWISDVSCNRVYGIALLIRDIFRTLFINNSKEIKANRLNKMKSNSLLNISDKVQHTSQDFVIDSIPIAGNNSNLSCSIDVVLGKRNRSMKSPEYLLTNSSAYNYNRSGFPFISKTSIEFHLQISFSLYPSLLILSKPDKNCTTSPYENFIHIIMLIIWTLNRFEEILQDRHEYLNLLIKLSSFILNVSKCILNAIEFSVNEAIQWRIAQPLVDTHDESYDHGSIEALKDMISWAILAIKKIASYLNIFRSVIVLSGQFELPRSLIVILPRVQALIERTFGRVLYIAKSSSSIEIDTDDVDRNFQINTSKTKDETIEQIGDKAMYLRMISFLEKHDKLLTDLIDESIFMNSVEDKNINEDECSLSPSVHDNFEDKNNECHKYSDGDDDDQGFVAITSNGGWGLYNHTPLDNDYDDNYDGKSSFNESENYCDSVSVGSSDYNRFNQEDWQQSEDVYEDSSFDEDDTANHYTS